MNKIKRLFILTLLPIILVGCSLPGLGGGFGQDTIKVAGLNTTEGQILSSMIKQLIEEETDYQVDLVSNLGSGMVAHQALLNRDADILANVYTGTDIIAIFGEEAKETAQETMTYLQGRFDQDYDQKQYETYGFENTFAILVTQELAEAEDLKTISDLKDLAPGLRAGFDQTWLIREGDGYKGFQDTYGIGFGSTYPMQVGLVYDAVASGEMDVVLGYSTDGRILSNNLVVLDDDMNFFPPYEGAVRTTNDFVETYPEVDSLLMRLAGKIDTDMMQALNYEADDNLLEPAVVAERFLKDNNYFREEVN